MVLFVQKTIKIHQLLVDTMADVLVVQSYRFSRAGVEETFVLPQLQLAFEVQDYGFFWEMGSPGRFSFLPAQMADEEVAALVVVWTVAWLLLVC